MADFGGFQVQTPQEVLAQLNARRQAISQLPPAQQRNANIQFQIQNLFGNPELRKAREVEDIMKGVDETVGTGKPGELEFERNRLSAMFTALKDVDPNAASQIATRLTELDEQEFERSLLVDRNRRAQELHDNTIREQNGRIERNERLNNLENVFYLKTTDPQTGEFTLEAYNPNDKESNFKFQRDKLKPNTVVLSRAEAVELGEDIDDADLKLHNNSGFTTRLGTYEAQAQAIDRATAIGSLLARNPQGNTTVAGVMNTLNEGAVEGKAAAQKIADAMGVNLDERGTLQAIDTALSSFQWYTQLDAQDQAAMKGMTLNMAYVLARSLDPSGRLSDADVMFATRMIGASQGDPRVLMNVMARQVVGNAQKVLRADELDLSGLTDREIRNSTQARRLQRVGSDLRERLGNFRNFAGHFLTPEMVEEIWNPGGTINTGASSSAAPTPAPAEEDDEFAGLSLN